MPFSVRYQPIALLIMVSALSATTPPPLCGAASADGAAGLGRHPLSHGHRRRDRHLLPRGGRGGGAGDPVAARLSHLLAHVPQPHAGARASLRVIARLPGVRSERHARPSRVHARFARFAELIDGLLSQLGVERYALYLQDYGAPVGCRLALRHPERITALVVQNGNAYEEGLKEFWNPIKAYWADGSDAHRQAPRGADPGRDEIQYLDGVRDPSRVAPDAWLHDQALLDRPGIDEIMLDLFKDYGSNVALYPQFQAFFRSRRPPTLIVWGQNDVIFPVDGAHPYCAICPTRNSTCSTRATRAGGQGRRDRHAHARLSRSDAATPVMWMVSASANATGGPKKASKTEEPRNPPAPTPTVEPHGWICVKESFAALASCPPPISLTSASCSASARTTPLP